jgi:5-methylthioadenosine/S-adenosylhomocysteine deaminase
MIYTARYVLPISSPHIANGAVAIYDGRIVAVGTLEQIKKKYPDENVEDLGTSAILPGFVDCHTHLDYSVMRGLIEDGAYAKWKYHLMQAEHKLDEDDWDVSAMLGALEAATAGITTVADITFNTGTLEAVEAVGLRALIYREVETMDKKAIASTMEAAVADIDAWRAQAGERVTVGIAPHSAYSCHPELFRAVADYAADGTPVAMHLAGSAEEHDFVKYGSSRLALEVRDEFDRNAPHWLPTGVSPVRYVLQWGILDVPDLLAIPCTQVDRSDVAVLANHDVAVAYCPRFNAKLGMGIAPLRAFVDAGLRVGIGTDSPAAANGMDMIEEMRTDLYLQRAAFGKDSFFTAEQALRLATLGGAEALKIADAVGSLDVGKKADIIAIDLSKSSQIPTHSPESAIVHSSHPSEVFFTMVDGEVIYRDTRWTRVDGEKTKAASEEIRRKLHR